MTCPVHESAALREMSGRGMEGLGWVRLDDRQYVVGTAGKRAPRLYEHRTLRHARRYSECAIAIACDISIERQK